MTIYDTGWLVGTLLFLLSTYVALLIAARSNITRQADFSGLPWQLHILVFCVSWALWICILVEATIASWHRTRGTTQTVTTEYD